MSCNVFLFVTPNAKSEMQQIREGTKRGTLDPVGGPHRDSRERGGLMSAAEP